MSPLDEKTLGQALRREAARPDLTPFDLGDIQVAARGIRRRRQVAGGLAAALAVGVLVPGALLLAPGGDRVDDPVEQPTPELTEVEYGQEAVLDLREAGDGGTTSVPYLVDGEEIVVDGVRLPDPGVVQSLVSLGAGWLATGFDEGESYAYVLDADGAVTDEFLSTAPAHDPATGRTAYVVRGDGRTDADLVVADAEGDELWRVPVADDSPEPLGFDDDDVLLRESAADGGPETLQRVTPSGEVTEVLQAVGLEAVDPVNGVVAVQTRSNADASGCFAVLDLADGSPVWPETCDHGPHAFSPDGRFLVAGGAQRSGMGDSSLTVLDARTGEVVVDFEAPRGIQFFTVGAPQWEDSDSIVAAVQQSDSETEPARYSIVRLDLDGTLETVAETLPYDEAADFRYFLL